ncbi:MAG: formylglycine-generating enzyme family protein [Gammaproteobacteria bacterium]|nr:formylglycine-generating enzyme family protein [Gammaproteobacteria bacterium]MBU1725921.1 formylglycine-generating enzyme family protein [Gammaproteobacteria bacterium]MBU2006373.1 formylglycine-generating enzyme family protein [Gammaproteobacteria bacterium]
MIDGIVCLMGNAVSVDSYPLSFFLEQLARTGIPVSVRDYRRIDRALSTQGEWTINRLERVLESLLVNERETRILFRQQFRNHFRHAGLDADALVDAAQWRQEIQQLLANPHAPLPLVVGEKETPSNSPLSGGGQESMQFSGSSPDKGRLGGVSFKHWLLGLVAMIVLSVLALAAWQYFQPDEPTIAATPPPSVDVNFAAKPQPQGELFDTIKVTTRKPQADERIMPDLWQPAAWLCGLLAAILGVVWWQRAYVPRVKLLPADPDLPAQYFDDALVGGKLPPWLEEADNDHFADQLRYIVTEQFTREVDVPASVEATAQSGSVPILKFEKQRELQQILILLEQGVVQQRWHGLAEEFANALQVRGVRLTLGRFNSSPARFVDQHGQLHHLEDWEAHQQHLLMLVFADTHKAIGLQTFAWGEWPTAKLLTLQEQRGWDHREQGLLQQGVALWQADAAGLAAALGGESAPARSLSGVEGNGQDSVEQWREQEGEECHDYLARVLGGALPWAQALALYPGAWSLAAAEVLRGRHFAEVPRLAVQRLLNLPGTWAAGGKAEFAPKVLAALRGGILPLPGVIETWTALLDAVEPGKKIPPCPPFAKGGIGERLRKMMGGMSGFPLCKRGIEGDFSLEWAVWRWKRIRLRWLLDPDQGAKELDQLVKSFPALRQTVGDEMVAIPLPATRKGRKHLVAVSDKLGLKQADAYLPVRWQRGGSLAALLLALAFVGVGIHNTGVPDGSVAGEIKDAPIPHLVEIRGGKFTMGCVESRDNVEGGCENDEKPAHEVTVPDFAISATEVTVAQFRAFVEGTGYETTAEKEGSCRILNDKGDDYIDGKGNSWRNPGFTQAEYHPVACVSWDDAKAYLQWLSGQARQTWRLPTEAEWEYAARAGTDTAYPWGNAIGENKANCDNQSCKDQFEFTSPVASFAPYGGVYDMQGNVWEWAEDCWEGDYKDAPTDGSARPGSDTCVSRVVRGGSWFYLPGGLRASDRTYSSPATRLNLVGFRAARTINPLPSTVDAAAVQVKGADAKGEVPPSPPFAKGGVEDVPEMVNIAGGKFTMGCVESRDNVEGGCDDDEKPAHEVTVKRFLLGKYEVTNQQYVAFLNAVKQRGTEKEPWFSSKDEDSSSHILAGKDGAFTVEQGFEQHPVINVSWFGAKAYLDWLSSTTGRTWRLPTEAEWEFAARAGTDTAYPWGNKASHELANYGKDECCGGLAVGRDKWVETAPVGSFPASQFGLHDMQGNVYEWAEDCWQDNYKGASVDGAARTGCDTSVSRVVRGGSWSGLPRYLRASNRSDYSPATRDDLVGFRAARTN